MLNGYVIRNIGIYDIFVLYKIKYLLFKNMFFGFIFVFNNQLIFGYPVSKYCTIHNSIQPCTFTLPT